MERKYLVYMHTFPNGKVYIGITGMSSDERWQNGRGYNQQPLMKYAICKYGWDNVKHDILESELTKSQAKQNEILYIQMFRSNERNFGYNLSLGGEGIGMHSDESRKKMSSSQKGKKRSDETKAKISESNRKRSVSDSTRKKMRDKKIGKHWSRDDKFKKPVYQYDINTGDFVHKYSSLTDASISTGIPKGHIGECVQSKRRQAGNYIWIYESDVLNGLDVDAVILKNQRNSLFKPIDMCDQNGIIVKHFPHTKSASNEFSVSESTIRRYIEHKILIDGYALVYSA